MFKIPTASGINLETQLGGMTASHMSLGWGFLKVSLNPKKLTGECLPICISSICFGLGLCCVTLLWKQIDMQQRRMWMATNWEDPLGCHCRWGDCVLSLLVLSSCT
jgi:hypothetical protein